MSYHGGGLGEIATGQWWDPRRPERRLYGALLHGGQRGWVLRLDGSFEDPPWVAGGRGPVAVPATPPDDLPVLLGLTSKGRLVSLFGCSFLSAPLPGLPGSAEVSPGIIAYDVHFNSPDDFRLASLSVRYSNMDAWAATSGFSVEFPTQANHFVSVRYSLPDAIEVTLPNALTVAVQFAAKGPLMTHPLTEVQITQRVQLTVASLEARPYEELMRISAACSDFIALGVGQPVRPLEITGTCDAEAALDRAPNPSGFEIIRNSEVIAPVLPDVSVWDMLFSLGHIRERFTFLLQAWFAQQERIRPLYDLYFATIRSSGMYVEHRFLNMFQALESYDRRTYEPPPEKRSRINCDSIIS